MKIAVMMERRARMPITMAAIEPPERRLLVLLADGVAGVLAGFCVIEDVGVLGGLLELVEADVADVDGS